MSLYEAKDHLGARRFYPYGQHPAMQRQRDCLKKLYDLPGGQENMAVRWQIMEQMYKFEAGETEAKVRFLEQQQEGITDSLIEAAGHMTTALEAFADELAEMTKRAEAAERELADFQQKLEAAWAVAPAYMSDNAWAAALKDLFAQLRETGS